MPSYSYNLEIPSGTSELEPLAQSGAILKGVIRNITLHFPSGCMGLAHIYFMCGSNQILPIQGSPELDIALDDVTLKLDVNYFNMVDKEILQLCGWNSDSDSHTIKAIVEVEI